MFSRENLGSVMNTIEKLVEYTISHNKFQPYLYAFVLVLIKKADSNELSFQEIAKNFVAIFSALHNFNIEGVYGIPQSENDELEIYRLIFQSKTGKDNNSNQDYAAKIEPKIAKITKLIIRKVLCHNLDVLDILYKNIIDSDKNYFSKEQFCTGNVEKILLDDGAGVFISLVKPISKFQRDIYINKLARHWIQESNEFFDEETRGLVSSFMQSNIFFDNTKDANNLSDINKRQELDFIQHTKIHSLLQDEFKEPGEYYICVTDFNPIVVSSVLEIVPMKRTDNLHTTVILNFNGITVNNIDIEDFKISSDSNHIPEFLWLISEGILEIRGDTKLSPSGKKMFQSRWRYEGIESEYFVTYLQREMGEYNANLLLGKAQNLNLNGYTNDNVDTQNRYADLTKEVFNYFSPYFKVKSIFTQHINELWDHQKRAIEWFIDEVNGVGILAMATGTGKTRTAIKIVDCMLQRNMIKYTIINTSERLLRQWETEIKANSSEIKRIYWHKSGEKNGTLFLDMEEKGSVLLVTYGLFPEIKKKLKKFKEKDKILLIVDEVHNLGSTKSITNAQYEELEVSNDDKSELISPLNSNENIYNIPQFRLGLSATPFSEYSIGRNQYIVNNFVNSQLKVTDNSKLLDELIKKNLIFYYSLEDGIRNRILVPFNYYPLPYTPTKEELKERAEMFRKFSRLAEEGEVSQETPYIMASSVLKRSIGKLKIFQNFINKNQEMIMNSISFCHTIEFAERVAEITSPINSKYRIFVSGENENTLNRFSDGEIDYLISCKRISEGVDIKNVKNIFLFSSDKQKLETIQRIGRSLRRDPEDKNKIANIIDFIYEEEKDNKEFITSDIERREWLSQISENQRR